MIEYLAIPAWDASPIPLKVWVDRLGERFGPVAVDRESSTVAWLEVASARLRAYVQIEDGNASAINFELLAEDPQPAADAIRAAAAALGWEIHEDDGDEVDDEMDDD